MVNYLGGTLNDGSCHPYKKANEEAKFIHANSDHPNPF